MILSTPELRKKLRNHYDECEWFFNERRENPLFSPNLEIPKYPEELRGLI